MDRNFYTGNEEAMLNKVVGIAVKIIKKEIDMGDFLNTLFVLCKLPPRE